jgi:hypothetical protein
MNDFIILLTCTIDPKGVLFMQRDNVKERYMDYLHALEKWREVGYNIIFCENSGYDLTELKKKFAKDNIEFLSFDGQDFDRALGKGYGEQLTIDFAMKNSKYLSENSYLVKVNGRYFVPNIKEVINPLNYDSDGSNVRSALRLYQGFANSQFFVFNSEFYNNHFVKFSKNINDSKGHYFEHALADSILSALIESKKSWRHLNNVPIIEGISGTSGIPYSANWLYIIIKKITYKCQWTTG